MYNLMTSAAWDENLQKAIVPCETPSINRKSCREWILLKRGMRDGEWGIGNGEWGMGNGKLKMGK